MGHFEGMHVGSEHFIQPGAIQIQIFHVIYISHCIKLKKTSINLLC